MKQDRINEMAKILFNMGIPPFITMNDER
jgi:hypothetical protein